MAVFRESYSEPHEVRSLAPCAKVIALTATATSLTRKTVMDVLLMDNPHVIFESPGKHNVAYSVYYIPEDKSLDYFHWLGDELMTHIKTNATPTVIYCQTIKQCYSRSELSTLNSFVV